MLIILVITDLRYSVLLLLLFFPFVVTLDTTSGTLIVVHLDTSAPMTNSPRIEAPSVTFCNIFPAKCFTKSNPFFVSEFKSKVKCCHTYDVEC